MLKAPCEEMARYLLPALRGAVVSYMYTERRMRQVDIAKLLGISQSAVSRYVNMERGLNRRIINEVPGMREVFEGFIARLERGERVSMCELCRDLAKRGVLQAAIEVIRGGPVGGVAEPPCGQ